MDAAHDFGEGSFDHGRVDHGGFEHDDGSVSAPEPMFELGGDERRMHVRAYNHWVSLLKNRPYPSIEDLDPEGIVDFGPHSVLLDFTGGLEDPRLAYLGPALRDECGLERSIARISEVPSRSLLSRLTDHYLQIIANCAPIGFEAEFVNTRERTTLYRGILMPFSSDGEGIDFIYGVINWKEVVDAQTQATLDAELASALRDPPRPVAAASVWADGPSAIDTQPCPSLDDEAVAVAAGSLDDQLILARESAAAVRAADTRSRSALYRALGRAHDFALAADSDADGYRALLDRAGIAVQARAPMTGVAKLVFGADYDKTRLTEFAAVLSHARRQAIAAGELAGFLDAFGGGIKAVVATERQARKPGVKPTRPMTPIADRAALAEVTLVVDAEPGSALLLVARVAEDGRIEVVGSITGSPLVERALRGLR